MKQLNLALLVVLLQLSLATSAWAGHQADYSMSISMDSSAFAGMASMFGEAQANSPTKPAAPGSEMDATVMHGKVYWDRDHSRIDMFYDPQLPGTGKQSKLQSGDVVESIIVFNDTGKTYRLLHAEHQAIEYDNIADFGDGAAESSGIPDLQPDRMIRNYDEMIARLRNTEGMAVTELKSAHINGIPVDGVSFIMDIQEIMKSMDGSNGMPDLSALSELGNSSGDGKAAGARTGDGSEEMLDLDNMLSGILSMLGNVEGEIWYSKELEIVMRMTMNIMGMNTSIELDSVFEWKDNGHTFVVPDDYTMVDGEEYMREQMKDINKSLKQLKQSPAAQGA
jgi:hypothetical protein